MTKPAGARRISLCATYLGYALYSTYPRKRIPKLRPPGVCLVHQTMNFRIIVVSLLIGMPALGEVTEDANPGGVENAKPPSWLDARYDHISESADKLATWVDGFFSQSRSVEDAASTLIRIRPQHQWDEEDGSDWKLRATGRLYLPSLNDRFSIVFVGEEGDFNDEFYQPALASDGSSTVGLQYRAIEEKNSRIDLTAGLKAGPKGKLGGKYRYQLPFRERYRFRFSEEVFWIGGDGFGTLTRVDLDRSLDADNLLRWANKARYTEESNGVEWVSSLGWARRLSEKSAIRSSVFVSGETDPRFLKAVALSRVIDGDFSSAGCSGNWDPATNGARNALAKIGMEFSALNSDSKLFLVKET